MPQIPVPGFLLFTCHCQAGSCTESLQLLPYFPIATVVALAEVPASPLLPHHSSASSPPLSTPVHTPLGNLLKHTAPHVTPGPAAAPPPTACRSPGSFGSNQGSPRSDTFLPRQLYFHQPCPGSCCPSQQGRSRTPGRTPAFPRTPHGCTSL